MGSENATIAIPKQGQLNKDCLYIKNKKKNDNNFRQNNTGNNSLIKNYSVFFLNIVYIITIM